MKIFIQILALASAALAFTPGESVHRREVLATSGASAAAALVVSAPSVQARGFATLEQAYERYTPRIKKGGEFYAKDFRQLGKVIGLELVAIADTICSDER